MSTLKIKLAKDLSTNELIYFKGHAGATYMSNGLTVEEAINSVVAGDTKNTSGATNNTSKLFLIGATEQSENPQTYSNENVYADTDGSLKATAFYLTSDVTKKNVLESVQLSLEQLSSAPIIKFTWKDENSEQKVGTIAQYWQNILPEVVNGEEGNFTVDYATLATVNSISLARIVKEQLKQIEMLQLELNNIKELLK